MSRTLSFIMTGPPTLDAGTFVSIVDDETGQPIEPGWWQHDGTHWRYYLPYEFAPRLVTPPPTASVSDALSRAAAQPPEPQRIVDESDAILARQRRKTQIAGAQRRDRTTDADGSSSAQPPAHWETCPSCQARFDPAAHELFDCPNCGESKCTSACMPDPTRPCVDCQALDGAAEEQDQVAAPPSGALFDGVFRSKDGRTSSADDDEKEG